MDKGQPLCPFTSVAVALYLPLWGPRDHFRHPLGPRCVKSEALDPAGLGSNPSIAAYCCVPWTSCLTDLDHFLM